MGRQPRFLEPTALDLAVRELTSHLPPGTARAMRVLFPVGMPGGYVTIAHLTAFWLRRRGGMGGRAIVAAAYLGWLSQFTVKKLVPRRRPHPRVRHRIESFPSGHTTGTTATALTIARVLHREGLISARTAALLAIGAPAAMGAYRIIDDEHWATDVIGGWLLGSAVSSLACSLLGDRSPRRQTDRLL